MASLETTKKIINSMEPNSFLNLVSKVLFKDVDSISNYATYDMYYIGDVVLIPSSVTNQEVDNLYICNKNAVTGPFNENDWKLYTITNMGKNGFLESKRYTVSQDNTSSISLGLDVNLDTVKISLTHSVRGKLQENVHWSKTSINTIGFNGFTLFDGEYVDFDIYG